MTVKVLIEKLERLNHSATVAVNVRSYNATRFEGGEIYIDALVVDVRDITAETALETVMIFAA